MRRNSKILRQQIEEKKQNIGNQLGKLRRFTVITVCYNAEQTIEATIKSLLNQNFNDYEYIIKDGGSTDSTLDIIKTLIRDKSNISIISSRDNGIYDAMNIALESAMGQYIYFLNSGDQLADNNVLKSIDATLNKEVCDIIYGNIIQASANGEKIRKYENICSKKIYSLTGDCICHQALFAKRNLLKEHKFDISYKVCADREWEMYCISRKATFKSTDIIIARAQTEGYSTAHIGDFENEAGRCIRKYEPGYVWVYVIIQHMKNNKYMLRFLKMIENRLFIKK